MVVGVTHSGVLPRLGDWVFAAEFVTGDEFGVALERWARGVVDDVVYGDVLVVTSFCRCVGGYGE